MSSNTQVKFTNEQSAAVETMKSAVDFFTSTDIYETDAILKARRVIVDARTELENAFPNCEETAKKIYSKTSFVGMVSDEFEEIIYMLVGASQIIHSTSFDEVKNGVKSLNDSFYNLAIK